tara:strand:- start:454 stop:705 length:252 start_codon:yes stop_codon:yes gene_type:complete
MMSDKDCKDFEKTLKKINEDTFNPRGSNDLEEQIRVLKFRNETLHKHTEKQAQEINSLRLEIKRLEKEVSFYARDQFRNQGDM